jgi:predicted AlkP superfamily pyrophosphatase or phosphodiesterase
MNEWLGSVMIVLWLGCYLRPVAAQQKPAPSTELSSQAPMGEKENATKAAPGKRIQHVLMISFDGMHALDLALFVKAHPDSTFGKLARRGITYTNAVSAIPSDATPGILAIATGGTPNATGVYYGDGYDRTLSPAGSKCETRGAVYVYDEAADIDLTKLDAGGGMDPAKMLLDPNRNCARVYPHDLLRVNTIFEVVKANGGRTAWADGHPSTGDFMNGPSGKGLDDAYMPEMKAMPGNIQVRQKYDELKLAAVLNQIHGMDHTGATKSPVPTVFGMTFVSVSDAQKKAGNGYLDGMGTPSEGLKNEFLWADHALGQMVEALQTEKLYDSTAIFVTAKFGQSPIDPTMKREVPEEAIPDIVESVRKGLLAHCTVDTVALVWLTDQSRTPDVVKALRARAQEAGIEEMYSGEKLKLLFNDPEKDPRVPDIIVQPRLGVIYMTGESTKIAEHGGSHGDDIHVALLVSYPGGAGTETKVPVETKQIAPTALAMLGVDPNALKAVMLEHTETLPGTVLENWH